MTGLYFQNAVVLNHTGRVAHSVRIERDKITALDTQPLRSDLVLDLEGRIILPGLINAHDHLAMNNFGKIKYRSVYSNAHDWSLDIEARFDTDPAITNPRRVPVSERLFLGAMKNLLAGVTTVCHHDPWHRSLDRRDFPVRVVKAFGYCHSLQRGTNIARSYQRTPRGTPWIVHLAEGTDDASARELETLDKLGCLGANTVLVHGVGLTREQREKAVALGASLIWCPSSNLFLLGRTAEICEFKQAARVALGTDSLLTGVGDIWDELRVANSTQQATPNELLRLMTRDAAQMLRLNNLGEIKVGAQADLLILPASRGNLFDDFVNFTRGDIQLVIISGNPRYGDPAFATCFSQEGIATKRIRVDGKTKLLDTKIAGRMKQSCGHGGQVEL